jgi:hypothetical protein
MSNLLKKLYFSPTSGFISAYKLYQKAKPLNKSITLKQVKEWYLKQVEIQQHQTKNKQFELFKIASYDPDSWQIDLAFVQGKPILTAININSRIGFLKLLSNKRADTVLKALQNFIKTNRVNILTSDNGTEFMNSKVQKYLKVDGIEHYNNEKGDHSTLGKIDRFIRTIKQRLIKLPPSTKISQKLLNDIIENYNNTYHSTIKSTPNDQKGNVIQSEIDHNHKVLDNVSQSINPGDSVRYKLQAKTFSKEGAKYSKAVYEIIGIDGYRVHIKSKNGHTLYKPVNDLKVVDAEVSSDVPFQNNDIYQAVKILSHEKLKNGKYKYLILWDDGSQTKEPQKNLRLVNKNKMSQLELNYFK